jgi:glycosyltransferase involved in cell wall biosynthesis
VKIAQVAPLFESVPPKSYGGTERVVSNLTEELVRQGHDVTLYATGDSETAARLVALWPRSLRLDSSCRDPVALHVYMIERVIQEADDFDIVHFHCDYLHYPISRRIGEPNVTTLHGRLDLPELEPLYREFRDMPLVSISDAQRAPLPFANWKGTVHHGIPKKFLSFHERPGNYLAFLGRMSPEKGADQAIEIACRAGIPIKLAAKVDRADEEYFEAVIRPLLDGPGVEFIGEIGDAEKDEFLGNALALVFPIDWPEPFGLVMIEAMACGTPTICYPRGSVPEIIEDGVSGFLAKDIEEAVGFVEKISSFDRRRCRRSFEERFTVERMARNYLKVYERILSPVGI